MRRVVLVALILVGGIVAGTDSVGERVAIEHNLTDCCYKSNAISC